MAVPFVVPFIVILPEDIVIFPEVILSEVEVGHIVVLLPDMVELDRVEFEDMVELEDMVESEDMVELEDIVELAPLVEQSPQIPMHFIVVGLIQVGGKVRVVFDPRLMGVREYRAPP